MSTKVFVSVGRTSTPDQEAFVCAIESHMLDHGLVPQALGRNYWSSKQPLKAIDELMSECSGVAIVGFERLRILEALDRRGSDGERTVSGVALPTVWNQIEAAMAYSRGLPLLVVIDQELRTEGLLETGYDWYVKRVPLGPRVTLDREFCGIFDDWRARVDAHRKAHAPQTAAPASPQAGSSPTLEARRESAPPSSSRRQLRLLLETRFSDDELRALCFDLDVDYENLPGSTKAGKTVAIIGYFERVGRIDELVQSIRTLRPGEVSPL